MRDQVRICMYYVYMTVAFGCLSMTSSSTVEEAADKLIKTRKLREAGYETFEVASSHIELHNNERLLPKHLRKRRDLTEQRQTLTLKLNRTKDKETPTVIVLEHVPSVLHPDAILKVQTGSFTEILHPKHTNCYLRGFSKTDPGLIASFSYCHRLTGVFYDETSTFLVESLDDQTDEHEINEDTEHILIARRPTSTTFNDLDIADRTTLENEISEKVEDKRRETRSTPSITIETAVIADQLYTSAMKAKGHTTNQEWVDLMILKWNAVQAEWGKADQLGYDVKIEIKAMEFWETNPKDRAIPCYFKYFNPKWQRASIHRQTGTDVAGKAILGGICSSTSHCAVSTNTAVDEFNIATHELGHQFSMIHDGDSGCASYTGGRTNGIMGSGVYSWSNCSVAKFLEKMGKTSDVSCLSTVNVNTGVVVNLTEAWPGMVYTPDEICAYKTGPGYRYRSFPYTTAGFGYCGYHSCINMNTSSPEYGLSVNYVTPSNGRYCGDGMFCTSYYNTTAASYECVTLAQTGVVASAGDVVTGGWSAWGAETSCSRTCGTGVRYRQRICDNPKPMNTEGCAGSEYSATLCNPTPCPSDSTTEATLITQRAGETCTHLKSNSLYEAVGQVSSNYENTGVKYGWQTHFQCEVKCDRVSDFTAPAYQRYGLMPDGTPCSADIDSFVEANSLARASGFTGKCLQGYCEIFGCDDTNTGAVKDKCGVCGGDNSNCTAVEEVMTTNLAQGDRVTLVEVPSESFLIQAYFSYSDMELHYVELYSKDDTPIIATTISGVSRITGNNLDQPAYFAGTHWYYHATKQYLYAEGPITEPVVLKFYNDGTNTNAGVNYAYSRPLTACTVETCVNGGTWNSTLCTCDCPSGFYGDTCASTCTRYCKNNQGTTASCGCDCTGNTYGTNCNCKYPFTGPSCTECKTTTCQNGGVLNSTSCRCACPAGYGSLDCSTICEDNYGDTAWCISNRDAGKCDSKNELMEARCYMTCGLCEYANATSTTSSPTTATTAATTSTSATTTTTTTSTTTSSTTASGASTASTSTTVTTTQGNETNPQGSAGRLGPNVNLIVAVLPVIVFPKLYRYYFILI